jgi:hypothetical protein
MFLQGHLGIRHLWPALLFLPWVLIGLAYLVESTLHRFSYGRKGNSRAL